MKLTFLGTRGYIETKSRRHRRHTALLVSSNGSRVMLDCGEDWRGKLDEIAPDAIVLTHAHPDHAFGLKDGTDLPVYASRDTAELIADFPIRDPHVLPERSTTTIAGIQFEAFSVEHSTRCPARGYRVTVNGVSFFYAPDVVYINERDEALTGVELFIGDGATLERPLVRKRGGHLIGHTPIRTQLTWCGKAQVAAAVFTHCGSQIVKGDERTLRARVRRWAKERGVDAQIAHDGMEIELTDQGT